MSLKPCLKMNKEKQKSKKKIKNKEIRNLETGSFFMLKIFNNNFVFSSKVILLIDKNIAVKNSVEETSVG